MAAASDFTSPKNVEVPRLRGKFAKRTFPSAQGDISSGVLPLDWFWSRPVAGSNSLKAPVGGGIDHHTQGSMIVIAQRDETERLQRPVAGRAHRGEHFGHTPH